MVRKAVQSPSNKVVLYLRVSTEEQGKSGLGLEAQLELCQRVSNELGLEIAGVFQDIISGKTNPAEREGFIAAIQNTQQYKAQLMVAKLDRLARDVYYISSLVNGHMFKKAPKLIIADNPNASEFEINIRASISQEERKMIGERTKAALAIRKSQGVELGKVGREVVATRKREATEGAVTRAKELQEQGNGLTQIAEMLNQEGFKTSSGSAWTKQALYKRLKASS